MTPQTTVTNILDLSGVKYRLLPHGEAALTCEAAAAERGVPLAEMVKCLVLLPKKGATVVACVPGDRRLSLRKIKRELGVKAFAVATPTEIAQQTGFAVGSIAPLGLPTEVLVVVDCSLRNRAKVNISSGDPTCGIELPSFDLWKLIRPRFLDISE